jgi:hypothetical protein
MPNRWMSEVLIRMQEDPRSYSFFVRPRNATLTEGGHRERLASPAIQRFFICKTDKRRSKRGSESKGQGTDVLNKRLK